jgi:predicted nucleic acid-binding protein
MSSAMHKELTMASSVSFDGRIADGWGTLKARLRARGRLKADIDLLIAATVIAEDAVLVTDDADLD